MMPPAVFFFLLYAFNQNAVMQRTKFHRLSSVGLIKNQQFKRGC